jgi:clan AA aspartic protease (TIGR02281 family)
VVSAFKTVKGLFATIVAAGSLLSGCAPALPQSSYTVESSEAYFRSITKCSAVAQVTGAVDLDRYMACIRQPWAYPAPEPMARADVSTRAPSPRPAGSSVVAAAESKDEIRLQPYGGVFAVPVTINGAVSIPFVLDSGASEVRLPAEVVFTLLRTGTLSEGDFIGASTYVLANGSTLRSPRFRIREMRVGEHTVRNVTASVGPAVSSDALLGQSFLSNLPSWTLDNKRHVLIWRASRR